jgi:hypothetical protein
LYGEKERMRLFFPFQEFWACIQTRRSQFKMFCVCVGCFWSSSSSSFSLSLSSPPFPILLFRLGNESISLAVLLCVCARGRRRRKASLRECSRLVFWIYRSAPEFLLLHLLFFSPPRLFNQPNQSDMITP